MKGFLAVATAMVCWIRAEAIPSDEWGMQTEVSRHCAIRAPSRTLVIGGGYGLGAYGLGGLGGNRLGGYGLGGQGFGRVFGLNSVKRKPMAVEFLSKDPKLEAEEED